MGLVHEFTFAGIMRQYADILLTMLLCWMYVLYSAGQPDRRLRFVKLVLNAAVATAALKIGLIAYAWRFCSRSGWLSA